MASVELGSTRQTQVKKMVANGSPAAPPAKRFHGRLKIDTPFLPDRGGRSLRHRSVGNPQRRRSRARMARCSSSRPTAKSRRPGASWRRTSSAASISTAKSAPTQREYSVRQLIHRVARTIADWGMEDGYFASHEDGERFYRDLAWLCLHQHGAFNSPVWFNVGLYHQYGVEGRQVQLALGSGHPRRGAAGESVRVSARLGLLHPARRRQHGRHHGAGPQRGHAVQVRLAAPAPTCRRSVRTARSSPAAGSPSGPLSFMRVYDQIAAVVKSGGKTRRAAKMQSLKVWHPDIMEFIECKWKEEQKARVLIEKGGYEANFNGEAYSSIMFQNANLSVRVTDDFMQAVEKDARLDDALGDRSTTRPGPTYKARDVHEPHGRMCLALRRSGRAVRHDDQPLAHLPQQRPDQCQQSVLGVHVPRRHGLQSGEHQPDEVPPRRWHVRRRSGSRRPVGSSSSPRRFWSITPAIRPATSPATAICFRPLGLGYSNLGSLLMSSGLPYDSRRRPRASAER